MHRTFSFIRTQFIYVSVVAIIIFIVATGYNREAINTENISNVRSIQAVHLVSKYNKNLVRTKTVGSFDEVLAFASSMPVKFKGSITGYGPDCEGCGGRVGCPPRPNVKNGNVYFTDQEYGKVNIVATDSRIPCGSIIKITDSSLGNEVVTIALDRGGAIKGTLMDFLVETEAKASKSVGRQKVTFEIVRWGW